jgi:hypothetical protein
MRLKATFLTFSLLILSSSMAYAGGCGGDNQGVSIRAVACVVNSISTFDTALQMKGESPVGMTKEAEYFAHRAQPLKAIKETDAFDMIQINRQQVMVQLHF